MVVGQFVASPVRQLGAIALEGNGPKLTHGAGFKLTQYQENVPPRVASQRPLPLVTARSGMQSPARGLEQRHRSLVDVDFVFGDRAGFHDERHVLEYAHVRQGVAWNGDQVGPFACLECARAVFPTHQVGGVDGG
jgi:hypothetical protein